MDLLQIYSHFY